MRGFSDLSEVEYEPPDSNISRLIARREFLLAVSRLKPEVVNDLLSRCWATFLRAAEHKWEMEKEDYRIVESSRVDNLLEDSNILTSSYDRNTRQSLDIILYDRLRDFTALRNRLFEWGQTHGLIADWCYDFGLRVLVDYWRTQLNWKPRTQLNEESEKEQERLRLEKPANNHKQSPPAKRLLPIFSKETADPVIQKRQKSLTDLLAKIESPSLKPQSEIKKEVSERADGLGLGDESQIDGRSVEQSANLYRPPEKYRLIARFASGIACEFHIDSWNKIAKELLKEAQSKLVAPEHRYENKYRFGGLFRPSIPIPEHQRPQPPKPPESFPPHH